MSPFFAPLGAVNFESPLLWGLIIAWIMTVVLHEFAHGIVAHWGGDYTIRERGGLTLNPFQYIDPVMSLAIPVLFLMIGGIALPGGVTYVHTNLLRSRAWESAVALAGPAMNLLILVALCGLTHPAIGLFDLSKPVMEWTNAQVVVGALAVTQALAIVLNLVPCPPLDGFNALSPYLPEEWVVRVRTPPVNFLLLGVFVVVVTQLPLVTEAVRWVLRATLTVVGQPPELANSFFHAFGLSRTGEG